MASVRGAVHELKSEVKDLGKKIDTKFDKADAKIDGFLHSFIGGILLKGGFDFYMIKDVQNDFERKMASAIEGIRK